MAMQDKALNVTLRIRMMIRYSFLITFTDYNLDSFSSKAPEY